MPPREVRPLRLLISCSPEDRELKEQLVRHLQVLVRFAGIDLWTPDHVQAGDDWRQEVDAALDRADVALLLISADFLASEFLQDDQVPKLFHRHEQGGLKVIPVLLGSCLWQAHPWLSTLKPLPIAEQAIASLEGDARDRALTEVVARIREVMAESDGAVSHEQESAVQRDSLTADHKSRSSYRSKFVISTGGYRDHGGVFAIAERSMIVWDAQFYIDFFRAAVSDNADPVLLFGILPHVSLFVVESMKYLRGRVPAAAQDLRAKYASVLQASGARLALIDEWRRGPEDLLIQAQWVTDLHRRWFFGSHSGLLAPLKQMLQNDLGLFSLDGRLVCTSHVAFFNQGFDQEYIRERLLDLANLGLHTRTLSVDVGHYLAQVVVSASPVFSMMGSQLSVRTFGRSCESKDVKSSLYYNAIASGLGQDGQAVAAVVTYILSYVNFINISLRAVVRAGSQAFFRAKFLVAYHVIGGLTRVLVQRDSDSLVATGARSHLRQLLDDDELRWLRKQDALRSLLTGYRIDGVAQDSILPERPMFGLVEALLPDQTFESIDALLDRVLGRLSNALQDAGLSL